MKRIPVLAVSIALVSFIGNTFIVKSLAAEIVVEGNGAGADSTVNASTQATTSVNQDNTANVDNNVNTSADTGNNQANNNGGETSIDTGNVNSSVEVNNDLNHSVADTSNCCNGTSSTTIKGNGANTTNTTNVTTSYNGNVSVTNTANITNNIKGKANTGGNTANNNNGDVKIKTGSIKVSEEITNVTNTAVVKLGQNFGSYSINIKNNGEGSVNNALYTLTNDYNIYVFNQSDIFNNSSWDLNTGNNSANGNSGDVEISTGDIDYTSKIKNYLNESFVKIDCCHKDTPEPPKPPKPQPPTPGDKPGTPGIVNGTSASSSGSSGPGASVGDILPATGAGWLFLALIANILMLMIGSVLRLRSGRAPGILPTLSI